MEIYKKACDDYHDNPVNLRLVVYPRHVQQWPMTSLTIPENISPQAAAWRRSQLGKSRVELAVERVLAIRLISATCWAAYSLLSESQRERLMHWLGE